MLNWQRLSARLGAVRGMQVDCLEYSLLVCIHWKCWLGATYDYNMIIGLSEARQRIKLIIF